MSEIIDTSDTNTYYYSSIQFFPEELKDDNEISERCVSLDESLTNQFSNRLKNKFGYVDKKTCNIG